VPLRLALLACALPLLLPAAEDPTTAANRLLRGLINVSGPEVKGAHDAEFVLVGSRAYIVSMANDVQPGENAEWPFVYCTLSVVDLPTMQVVKRIPMAKGGQAFRNTTLPAGACFVPRIIQKDRHTLRTFFASEAPGQRQSQSYYLDFDVRKLAFSNQLHPLKLRTRAGLFPMQPQHFYNDAVAAQGFRREPKDFGLYNIDSFKQFDGQIYVVMNNYPGGQNGLALLNKRRDTFTVVGHFNPTGPERLTESAVHRLPDGTWLAICRQDGGTGNYMFSTSPDGKTWTAPAYRDWIPNGASSKPNLEKFNGTYYLGWQESTRVDGVSRSVFNIDVSSDGRQWQRRYRFATAKSFQYASFHQHQGTIYFTVTQGDSSPSRKERILFGKLD
jgi:hypothetical protein